MPHDCCGGIGSGVSVSTCWNQAKVVGRFPNTDAVGLKKHLSPKGRGTSALSTIVLRNVQIDDLKSLFKNTKNVTTAKQQTWHSSLWSSMSRSPTSVCNSVYLSKSSQNGIPVVCTPNDGRNSAQGTPNKPLNLNKTQLNAKPVAYQPKVFMRSPSAPVT